MELNFLKLLSHDFPTIQAVSAEIINLNAICCLPKGTEHFMSDLHGEDKAFCHIMNNCSGALREKIDDTFADALTQSDKTELAKLLYYPQELIDHTKKKIGEEAMPDWYMVMISRLIMVCRAVTHKYTRSKVRKALPPDYAYAIDELLHKSPNDEDRTFYYKSFSDSIIALGCADEFIVGLCSAIKSLAVDSLHIVGDIFDRGPHADTIIESLMNYRSVDIQWGNHDVLWLGAAAGSEVCIANVVRNCLQYDNLDMLETSYGISLLQLHFFSQEAYANDDAEVFTPRVEPIHGYEPKDTSTYAKMHKAISVIMYKLDCQTIKRHPEFNMADRCVLDNIDFSDMTYCVGGKKYKMRDTGFPTIDPNNPCELTEGEKAVMDSLKREFLQSEKLQRHIKFLYDVGSMYKVCNDNLLYHGCVPCNEDGSFMEFEFFGEKYSGKRLFDFADKMARVAHYNNSEPELNSFARDFLWFLWEGRYSPIFGKEAIKTFEITLIDDKSLHNEQKNAYYSCYDSVEFCEKILHEFGITAEFSHIVNGHMPVKVKKGENPRHANGKLIVIDGGFCRAYHEKTGIAGYTLFYTSNAIRIYAHESYPEVKTTDDILNADINSTCVNVEYASRRMTVGDTDTGRDMKNRIAELTQLLEAYKTGLIKEGK